MFVILTMVSLASAADVQPGTRKWDFESDVVGKLPAEYRTAVGVWAIDQDGSNKVLSQTAKSADQMFNVVVRTDVLFSDVELSVRVKANAGFVDHGGAAGAGGELGRHVEKENGAG